MHVYVSFWHLNHVTFILNVNRKLAYLTISSIIELNKILHGNPWDYSFRIAGHQE